MSTAEDKRAEGFIQQANSVLNSWSFFRATNKFDDAAELYEKAANNYKMGKNYAAAADAYKLQASCVEKLDQPYKAAAAYTNAAEQLKQLDPPQALELYEKCVGLFGESGKFTQAAKVCETMGEILETDPSTLESAIRKYQQAADYYAGENGASRANKCLVKVARHSATLMNYPEAVKIFEKLGMDSLNSNLLKFNAKKHFLHAAFCLLARGDSVAASQAITRYMELDYTFSGSREQTLLEGLVKACEEGDAQAFSDMLFQYDSVTKMDPWEVSILLRVKKSMETEVVDDAEELL